MSTLSITAPEMQIPEERLKQIRLDMWNLKLAHQEPANKNYADPTDEQIWDMQQPLTEPEMNAHWCALNNNLATADNIKFGHALGFLFKEELETGVVTVVSYKNRIAFYKTPHPPEIDYGFLVKKLLFGQVIDINKETVSLEMIYACCGEDWQRFQYLDMGNTFKVWLSGVEK